MKFCLDQEKAKIYGVVVSNLGDCYKAVLKCFREKKSGKTTFGPGSVDLDSNIKCNFAKET